MPLKDIHIDIETAKPTPKAGLGTPLLVLKDTGSDPAGDVFGTYNSLLEFQADPNFASVKANPTLVAKINTLLSQPNRPAKFSVLSYATDADKAIADVWEQNFYFLLSGDDLVESQKAVIDAVDLKEFKQAMIQVKTIAEVGTYKTKKRQTTFYNPNTNEHLECMAIGNIGSLTVGSVTWKFRDGKLVTPVVLTEDEMKTIDDNRGIAYVVKYGRAQLTEGWTSYVSQDAPEYIDEIHGQDWIRVDMENELAKLLFNTPKLPYDQRGISALQAVANISLQRGYQNGIVGITEDGLPAFTVSAATKEQQTEDDILNRKYRGLVWSYGRSGAIHEVWVYGEITY